MRMEKYNKTKKICIKHFIMSLAVLVNRYIHDPGPTAHFSLDNRLIYYNSQNDCLNAHLCYLYL